VPARPERPTPVPDLTAAKRTAGLVALMVALAATRAAAASDRLAVLVVVEGDPDLSDNLTEVAISRLAKRRDNLLVGLREVRDSIADILAEPGIGACAEQPPCLVRLGDATRADSALLGDVRREADQFVVRLSLMNTRTAVREAEFAITVPADMKPLIAAIRTGVTSLFEPKTANPLPAGIVADSTPATAPLPPPPPPLSFGTQSAPSLVMPREEKPARDRWLAAVGYGAGGGAIIVLSAAIVIGKEATGTPTGATRQETLSDLQHREQDATIANGLLIVGSALAVAACAALLWRWRHD
jgi:hypothetical protein